MEIRRLRLTQYRSYAALDMRPGPGLNAILGDNAQGKTNAVEAIFLCAFGRSHRTLKDTELIMSGLEGGYVGAEIANATGEHTVELKLRRGERRRLIIDGQPAARSGELMGILNVVLFAPESLSIVTEGPAERRRFLDMEISQLKPAYYYRLQRYSAALRSRNALLKSGAEPALISAYTGQLSEQGAAIMAERAAFIAGLAPEAAALHGAISGGREQLSLCYRPSLSAPPEQAEAALALALDGGIYEDMRRGFTSAGPHRDDMAIALNGEDLRAYGSQGQKRTAALALKLSELALLQRLRGEPPVLILDDVLSELDASRQRMLISAVEGKQCFLTCTALEGLKNAGFANMKVFRCRDGQLFEE